MGKVGEHFRYLQQKLADSALIMAGRTDEEVPMGIAVFEAEDEAAARVFTENDPAIKAGVFVAEIKPFKVSLMRGS